MVDKQAHALSAFRNYAASAGIKILSEREINSAIQLKLALGPDEGSINIYTTGSITVGGKPQSAFLKRLDDWKKSYQAEAVEVLSGDGAIENRATTFFVAFAKVEVIREHLAGSFNRIVWHEGNEAVSFYRAEIFSRTDRVMVTQFRTGKLLVQGRASELFDDVCDHLDHKLSQPPQERAARYIPESTRDVALEVMNRPDMPDKALIWIKDQIGQDAYRFFFPHDQETLLSAALLLFALEEGKFNLPDYSVLVMPFGRAYEGFLLKLFIQLGMADEADIRQSSDAIRIGDWLNELKGRIVDAHRHGHLSDDLKTAWTGSRNLMMHSDPIRDTKITTVGVLQRETGVILRAIQRGYEELVGSPIELKPIGNKTNVSAPTASPEPAVKKDDPLKIQIIDEALLLRRLTEAQYQIKTMSDPGSHNKWQVNFGDVKVFCPRDPGDVLIVKGKEPEVFLSWYQNNVTQVPINTPVSVDSTASAEPANVSSEEPPF